MKTAVLIIGGGVTGTGLARDLALRGIESIVVERRDLNAGASGANHGLLHSGARYVASDPAAAVECRRESLRLKQLAPHCIEDTGGLFVAVAGDDESYIADFPGLCERCGITAQPLDDREARELEPCLSERLIAAYRVADAAIDPFRLALDNMANAEQLGGRLLRFTAVIGFTLKHHRIRSVLLRDDISGQTQEIEADVVVNAAGAWAGEVAALAGARIPMLYSKGSLLVTGTRIAHRVINRLRHPADGDILVPGGTVSILGTTSERSASPDAIYPEIEEVDRIIDQGAAMVPMLAKARFIRAYCGVRPLVSCGEACDDRSVSRGFALIDHGQSEDDPIDNLLTITGGKLTTYRLMAEKTADRVCQWLGHGDACRTQTRALPDTVAGHWTEPGLAPRTWMEKDDPGDLLLCECEMVSQAVVDDLLRTLEGQGDAASLTAIGLRSRIGKGPCQGTFCSQRVAAYLYDRGVWPDDRGIDELRAFMRARWRGQEPLLWDISLAQAELLEATHCGMFGLELDPAGPGG
ncbi:MAG: FAD-dependent oxidoreductase [Desulfobacterales bacterium]